jgi:aminopeptidase N
MMGSARRSFPLPTSKAQYAPDRRARVEHIALTLSFDFKRKILYGRCATTFAAVGGPLTSLVLQAGRMRIIDVRSGAKRLSFETAGDELRINVPTLAEGRSTTVSIEYEVHEPEQGIYFIGPDKGYPDKPYQVWTQGQDADAHYWFPCLDHPNAKATSEVIATVPADFFVLSNGALVSETLDKARKNKTYHWKMDVPHVTYLISVVAGKFVGRTSKADGIPVSFYVEPGREADGQRAFGKTPKMVRFFDECIGYKYPYAKYAQIAVRDFVFGGMENTTCTTQTDATLHDARAALDFSSDDLVAHELAHQWFGDLLTCKDWSHAWLNEGFATYFDALFKQFDLGEDEFAMQRIADQDLYLKEDDEHYRRPIVTNVFREPVDLFDRHLYEKGSSVLHMLRTQLGDDLWWRAINQYVTVNAMGSVETVDLARALEHVSGRNFARFFDQWVFGAGHPEFSVAYRWDDEAKAAVVDIKQTQAAADGTALFSVPLALDFALPRGKRERVSVVSDAREQTFRFQLPAKPQTFVFDPDSRCLERCCFASSQQSRLWHHASAQPARLAQTLRRMWSPDWRTRSTAIVFGAYALRPPRRSAASAPMPHWQRSCTRRRSRIPKPGARSPRRSGNSEATNRAARSNRCSRPTNRTSCKPLPQRRSARRSRRVPSSCCVRPWASRRSTTSCASRRWPASGSWATNAPCRSRSNGPRMGVRRPRAAARSTRSPSSASGARTSSTSSSRCFTTRCCASGLPPPRRSAR